MAYETQFAKVTNSGKLSDRFLTCQHIKSDDLNKSSMGDLFSVIEILSPWFPTAQIGKIIITGSAKYYYQGGSTSDLANFENSLKKVNEDLAQITQNGETEWIGNLNGLLVTIVGNNLHLASTGKADAYLFRDGKINHLTYGLANTVEPHPLKTFTNVISGELKNHDKILLTNSELFNHLPIESVRQIITLNNPSQAALQIAKFLKRDKNRNVNLIIINLISKEEVSSRVQENFENIYYLDKSTESIFGHFSETWENYLSPFGKIFGKNFKKMFSFVGNFFKKKEGPKEVSKTTEEKEPTDRFHKEFISHDKRDDNLLKDEEITYSPDLIHYYNERKIKEKAAPERNILRKITQLGQKIISGFISFTRWLIEIARDKRRRKYLFIALAIIIILVIVLVVIAKDRGGKVGNLQAQKLLDEAIAIQKEGNNLILAGDKEKGKEKLVLSIEKAEAIKDNSFVTKDAEQVIANSFEELDKITSTTRFRELRPIVSISSGAKGLFVISGQAYILTDTDIFEASLVGGTPTKVASLPKGKGNFISGARLDKYLYLYTSDQNLFEFDPDAKSINPTKLAQEARWETANSIAGYVGSLYLLDGVLGQIYKHSSDRTEFKKGEEYISTTSINLKGANSLAIDGSIYALKDNGQVIKILRSKKQDFSLKNLPTPYDKITVPRKISTDSDTPSIYILDMGQKRIIEFDKEGEFIHQYALPDNFDQISDFTVSAKARKIWILENNSLYEISI